MTSPKALARIAGSLYLTLTVCAIFAELYVRSSIIRLGDAATTADNIRASATLFRVGFVVDLVAATSFLLTAMALYLLLKHADQAVAAAMVTFVAVSVAISFLTLLNQNTALTIATSDEYVRTFGRAGSDALTLLFSDIQSNGQLINTIFFGLWLLPLGYLVIKSGYFPRVLGVLLIIGCFGYLVVAFMNFLVPDLGKSIGLSLTAAPGISELVFVAWLLVKGVRVPRPDVRPPSLAPSISTS